MMTESWQPYIHVVLIELTTLAFHRWLLTFIQSTHFVHIRICDEWLMTNIRLIDSIINLKFVVYKSRL